MKIIVVISHTTKLEYGLMGGKFIFLRFDLFLMLTFKSCLLVLVYGLLVKCGTAECGTRKVKCGMETVERWCGTVGKMRNAEICVCRRSFVHS